MLFFRDLRVAFHSLMRSKGLATIVILTLALGIGANAAIFTLVRGVLLKPLVNRDENRLMYIQQSAPSIGADNTAFSVPEIKDIEASVWFGFVAPVGTPKDMLAQFEKYFTAAIEVPAVKSKLNLVGLYPKASCGSEFGAFIAAQTANYTKFVKEFDIKGE